MAVMTTGTAFAATPFTDIAGTPYEYAVEVLSALDLVEGRVADMFTPYANMTRGELATVLMRLMNLETGTGSGAVFTDVPASHWACGNIEAAYGMGIINGIGDGKFAPDSNITYAQAVKMFVSALGYDVHAQAMGGYPAGYMAKASQLGLLKGVTTEGMDADLCRGDMAILMYNLLETPMLFETSFGAGASGGYAEDDGKTLISQYRGIYVAEGMADADYFTMIKTPDTKIDKGNIAVDGTVYASGATDAGTLLGYKVKVYYTIPDSTEMPTVLYAAPVSGTKAITLYADELRNETSITSIEYTDADGDEKSFGVDKGAILIANGVVKYEWTKDDIMIDNGTVTVIDNRGEEDVIFVNEYTNYVVSGKNTNEHTIFFKEAVNGVASLTFDPKDTAIKFMITDTYGNEKSVADVSEWDILSVAKGSDGKILKAILSAQKIDGKVSEKDDKETVIEGVSYKVDSNLPNGSLDAPELNQTAVFSLDFMGNIAAVNSNNSSVYKYGYLVGAANAKGINGVGQLKVFTEEGAMVLFDAADNIILNGTRYKATEVVDAIPGRDLHYAQEDRFLLPGGIKARYTKTGTTMDQLIKYRANDDNTKLLEILTANEATHIDPAEIAGDAGFNRVYEVDQNSRRLVAGTVNRDGVAQPTGSKEIRTSEGVGYVGGKPSAFSGQYGVKNTTKIFVIPKNLADDTKYEIMTGLSHGGSYYGMSLYDLSENFVAGAMVWNKGAIYGMSPEISDGGEDEVIVKYAEDYADGGYGMVTGVSKTVITDEYGDKVESVKISFYGGDSALVPKNFYIGYSIANTVNDDPDRATKKNNEKYISADQLGYGDVLQYSKDNEGYLDMAFVLIRAATPGMYELGTWGDDHMVNTVDVMYRGGTLVSTGTVIKAGADNIAVKTKLGTASRVGAGDDITRIYPAVADWFLEVDREAKTYRLITWEEVMPGDIFATIWEATNPRITMIYK